MVELHFPFGSKVEEGLHLKLSVAEGRLLARPVAVVPTQELDVILRQLVLKLLLEPGDLRVGKRVPPIEGIRFQAKLVQIAHLHGMGPQNASGWPIAVRDAVRPISSSDR